MEKNYFSHRLLVFTSSTAFMFIILGVINEVLEIQEAPNAINIFTFIITFFSGIIYVLIQHLFVNEKSNAGVHFRFMIIYMILMMTAAFFIFGRKFNSFIFISLIVQYLITNRIHDLFLRHQICGCTWRAVASRINGRNTWSFTNLCFSESFFRLF